MKRIGFIGTGKLATGLAISLKKSGHEIAALFDKDRKAASTLSLTLNSHTLADSPQEVSDLSQVVFITTPDSAIETVARECTFSPGKFVFHCSGALSFEILESARKQGAETGAFHPLQAFASMESIADLLRGTTFGIEGSEKSVTLLESFAEEFGGDWFLILQGKKPLYHAAAVFISNYQVTLARIAAEIFCTAGMADQQAINALGALMKGAQGAIFSKGLPESLTGPIERGDVEVIEKHLAALKEYQPELEQIYIQMGKETIPIALDKGSIDKHKAKIIFELLEQRQR